MTDLALMRPVGFEHLGYGTFGFNMQKGLEELGVDLLVNDDLGMAPAGGWSPPKDYRTVLYTSVPGWCSGRWESQFIACFTMWEATRIPESFISSLHNYDLVIVPNDLNLEQFGEWNERVIKVPLGHDTSTWTCSPRTVESTFRFFTNGAGLVEHTRKGSDVAIGAFERAFPHWQTMEPRPQLVLKCLACPPSRLPEFVELHEGQLPLDQVVALYKSCHAMVAPSRGEGWGLAPAQGLASGMPIIISDNPGHREYITLDGIIPISTEFKKAPVFADGQPGDWWEPSVDETVDAMREVYHNYDKWSELAQSGSAQINTGFSHTKMAYNTVEALEEAGAKLTRQPVGSYNYEAGVWQPFSHRDFRLITNRSLHETECSIAGVRYNFTAGHEYWVPANVCRVLEDAGYRANVGDRANRIPC